jgi:hypothetical protein
MQSLKSTFVAVLLFGLSLGLYQISDTSESSIDDSLIPAVDISDGSDLLVEQQAPTAATTPNSFAIAAPSALTPPRLQQSNSGQPQAPFRVASVDSKTDAGAKLRVPAPNKDNVQSFDYSGINESNIVATTEPIDDVRQRTLIQKDRDQGLINALQNQTQSQPTADFASGDFNVKANEIPPASTELTIVAPERKSDNRYQFASTEPVSGTAQPIGAADSSVTQLAGSKMPEIGNNNIQLAGSEPDLSSIPLNAAWTEVDRLVAETRYRDALKLLSRFYETEEANGPQRQRLLGWLDALAGKVIFSAEHHLRDQPYVVSENDSLVDLAQQWQVPAQLIYNINRAEIPNPVSLAPGTQLKMVDRPFDAKIDLKSNVMTLFFDGLYAGRYPVRIGVSGNVTAGDYRVLAKAVEGFRWRDSSGAEYAPDSPLNGYGPHWIGLSGSLCMHALKDGATEGHHGCIGLNPTDAADVFQILSQASTVSIVD